jgi:hypothetical protein
MVNRHGGLGREEKSGRELGDVRAMKKQVGGHGRESAGCEGKIGESVCVRPA